MRKAWAARRVAPIAIAVAAGFLLAACAPAAVHRAIPVAVKSEIITVPSLPDARYLGAILAGTSDVEAGFELGVPAADATPSLGASDAYATCLLRSETCNKGAGPTIQLALATTPGSGKLHKDGSILPTADHALSYVLTWSGLQCPIGDGPRPPTETGVRSTPGPGVCRMVIIIDANSGKRLFDVFGN